MKTEYQIMHIKVEKSFHEQLKRAAFFGRTSMKELLVAGALNEIKKRGLDNK